MSRASRLGLLALALLGCARQPRAAEPGPVAVPIYDAEHGLAEGWQDLGWSPHTLRAGSPARLDLSNYGGLILARPGLAGTFGALTFSYQAPDGVEGDFLLVQLQGPGGEKLGEVKVARSRGTKRDGYTQVALPLDELNPGGKRFERVVFHAWRAVPGAPVLLDDVALTAAAAPRLEPKRVATFHLDCGAAGHAISPMIYGVGGLDGKPWALRARARRWGGNPTTRYNWEQNTVNVGKDWFFRNGGGDPRTSYQAFLDDNQAHGAASALTVPMIGWVAKDTGSYGFPVSVDGPQQATAPELPDAGNGVRPGGQPVPAGPPDRTSVAAPPEFVERWVRRIRERDRGRGRSVQLYLLDNEPTLWNSTHRDVHPDPVGYDELLQRTLAYAAAIRRADPEARIGGPAEWGWLGYHYSARDVAAGVGLRPDRRAHGDVPLLAWYLRQIREHERLTGQRVLDVLDVHFYPMAQGMGIGMGGETDPSTAALRLRQTRGLWDPTYQDESWIAEKMAVLPLLQRWIAENAPGVGLSVGEWNFGAEGHISGGLAVAEVLGRFGLAGLESAFYWTVPTEDTPAFWAFRAYTDFDGAGGRFQDVSVPVRADGSATSLFASRDPGRRRVVAVLLNLAARSPLEARVDVQGCGPVKAARAFTYAGGAAGLAPAGASLAEGAVTATAAPYSLTVLDLQLAP